MVCGAEEESALPAPSPTPAPRFEERLGRDRSRTSSEFSSRASRRCCTARARCRSPEPMTGEVVRASKQVSIRDMRERLAACSEKRRPMAATGEPVARTMRLAQRNSAGRSALRPSPLACRRPFPTRGYLRQQAVVRSRGIPLPAAPPASSPLPPGPRCNSEKSTRSLIEPIRHPHRARVMARHIHPERATVLVSAPHPGPGTTIAVASSVARRGRIG